MKKKIVTWTLAISTLLCLFTLNVDANANTVSNQTPRTAKETNLNWAKTITTDWMKAPSSPTLVGNNIVFVSDDELVALNKTNGAETHRVKLVASASWAGTQPLYADGKIFVTLTDGYVQALNATTFTSLWVYKDELSGQGTTTLTYDDGYLYTGFWNSDSDDANYVCLSTADTDPTQSTEQISPVWVKTHTGGFYNAGACVVGDYVIFGSENGANYTEPASQSALYCVNKTTGLTATTASLSGDCRAPIAADGDNLYAVTTNGFLYYFTINQSDGSLDQVAVHDGGAAMTASPVIYKNRLYYGTSQSKFICADAKSLDTIYQTSLRAYPQASFLLSTQDEQKSGTLYFYSTYNGIPGGIQVVTTKNNATNCEVSDLYLASGHNGYCMSPILCDTDGTLYYKNDSYSLFSLSKKKAAPTVTPTPTPTKKVVKLSKPKLKSVKAMNKKAPYRVKISWKKVKSSKSYVVYMKKNSGKYKKIATTKKLIYTKRGLKKGVYRFRIKAVTTQNGKKITSKYSNSIKIALKK